MCSSVVTDVKERKKAADDYGAGKAALGKSLASVWAWFLCGEVSLRCWLQLIGGCGAGGEEGRTASQKLPVSTSNDVPVSYCT